jgi:hypothetical protein
MIYDKKKNRFVGFEIKTLSLIPLEKLIKFESISEFNLNKIKVKNHPEICYKENADTVSRVDTKKTKVSLNNKNIKSRLKDFSFNIETGELTDIIFSKNLLSQPKTISANKILLNDNTIYITDKEG